MPRNRKTTALVYGKENSDNIQVQNVGHHKLDYQKVIKKAEKQHQQKQILAMKTKRKSSRKTLSDINNQLEIRQTGKELYMGQYYI